MIASLQKFDTAVLEGMDVTIFLGPRSADSTSPSTCEAKFGTRSPGQMRKGEFATTCRSLYPVLAHET